MWHYKTAIWILVLIVIFFAAILVYYSYALSQIRGYNFLIVNGVKLPITNIAYNLSGWKTGLMNTSITNSTLMLFVFPNSSRYSFWMYNTRSNLDMIWINGSAASSKVVYIVRNAPPCFQSSSCVDYTPSSAADYVIEAKAGFVDRYAIEVGQNVSFS